MERERDHVGRLLGRLHLLYRWQIYQMREQFGVYFGQHMILGFIHANIGCTQQMVSKTLGISPPSVATSLKRMQKAGLILRQADESDRRCNRLYLTEEGLQMQKQAHKTLSDINTQMLSGFSDAQCADLVILLTQMLSNLEPEDLPQEELFSIIKRSM